MTGRYFSLGADADETADRYIQHYYGPEFFDFARADTLTDAQQIAAELHRLAAADCHEVVLYPCSGDLKQVHLLARIIRDNGASCGERPVSRDPSHSTGRTKA